MPKDHERNISPMQEARQKIIQEKYNTLKTVLEDMIHNDEQITAPRVCELSGLSKSYLYHNEKAKKLFDEAKALAEKKASRSYISSYDLERTDLDINPHMHHDDMLLQYEEIKRKLYETYMITFQLLKEENNRLKGAIRASQEKIKYLLDSQKFSKKITFQADVCYG